MTMMEMNSKKSERMENWWAILYEWVEIFLFQFAHVFTFFILFSCADQIVSHPKLKYIKKSLLVCALVASLHCRLTFENYCSIEMRWNAIFHRTMNQIILCIRNIISALREKKVCMEKESVSVWRQNVIDQQQKKNRERKGSYLCPIIWRKTFHAPTRVLEIKPWITHETIAVGSHQSSVGSPRVTCMASAVISSFFSLFFGY